MSEDLARRLEYILDPLRSTKDRIVSRAVLTNHDLRQCLAAVRLVDRADEIQAKLLWIKGQAESAMTLARGSDGNSDDLDMLESFASDIAINAQMAIAPIEARSGETEGLDGEATKAGIAPNSLITPINGGEA